jgi:hypothetical protein
MMPKSLKTPVRILFHLPDVLEWLGAVFLVIASFFSV